MKSRYKRFTTGGSTYSSKEAPNWVLKTAFFFLCLLILTDAYFIGKAVIRIIKEYPHNVTVNILVLFTLICICAEFMLFEYRPNGLFDDARELFRRIKKSKVSDHKDNHRNEDPTKHSKIIDNNIH